MTGQGESPVRVMVIDDHPMWRDAVARDLAEAGFDVVAVIGEGAQALRVIGAAQPDVSWPTCGCPTCPASR